MLSDKKIKEKFKPIFWKNPDKYYPTTVLKQEGYIRKICISCKKPFWNIDPKRNVCGDPICSKERFYFIEKTPAKNKLSYIEVWKKFSSIFKKLGYTPIKRYPLVARWNPTIDLTNSSISAFQPYVISGEVKPPANPLVIPQPCFRTVDIDNVGITGSHLTLFTMIGQHMFTSPEKWDQNQVFNDIFTWLKNGLGLPNEEIIFHEDAWAGGGNFGNCMEFFSRGCELGNQVYMLYEQTPNGYKELNLKVLDMGMGQERNAWFSQATNTIYDATFPTIIKKLLSSTKIKINKSIIKKYVPYGGLLNLDEIEDANKAWLLVASKINVDVKELKETVLPLAALYSVAEHSRALLFALSDGALPSNIGAYYNLRVIFRRAMNFIDTYNWNISLFDLCKQHSKYLKPIFPELSENLDDVKKILEVEQIKYENTKQKSKAILSKIIKQEITERKLLELYDSQGIQPEVIKQEAEKLGKKISVPSNFYAKISDLHEKKEQKHETKKDIFLDLKNIPETKALYFGDYEITKFKAKIVKVIDNYIILDKTYFYPTSGGQLYDTGTIANEKVVNVFKQGNIIIHKLKERHEFTPGEEVECEIDKERRIQLTQHHDAAHIINAAARKTLGNHVNQASAFKDTNKAHLDITHYQSLTNKEIKAIEKEANKIISSKLPIYSLFMPRDEAEKTYGFRIYQGGVPPGNKLRIVDIANTDVEACAGTHAKNTFEAGLIKILRAVKVSDSIVRIEFVAGKKASEEIDLEKNIVNEIAKILKVNKKLIIPRIEELFAKWKKVVKKKKIESKDDFILTSNKELNLKDIEIIEKASQILNTQPEHITKTINRFLRELKEAKK